jgi:hypothetical protein
VAWRSEWESLDQARKEITGYIDDYHRRPHSGLAYRTPAEVTNIWRPDPDVLQTPATEPSTPTGSTSPLLATGTALSLSAPFQ